MMPGMLDIQKVGSLYGLFVVMWVLYVYIFK